MELAIKEAIKAREKQEVPVGAIIVNKNGNIIAKAHNLVETRNDATSHAEKLVIEKALKTTGNRYLNDYDITNKVSIISDPNWCIKPRNIGTYNLRTIIIFQ